MSAIELAPAARVWAGAVAQYETLLLAELGYAEEVEASGAPVAMMAQNRERLVAHVLGDNRFRELAISPAQVGQPTRERRSVLRDFLAHRP